jgi:hypothetical protein
MPEVGVRGGWLVRIRTALPGHVGPCWSGGDSRNGPERSLSDHVDGPGPRAVALDEENRLPGPEIEFPVDDGERLARTEEERPEVRVRVLVSGANEGSSRAERSDGVTVEPVVFPPLVGNQVVEERRHVLQEA